MKKNTIFIQIAKINFKLEFFDINKNSMNGVINSYENFILKKPPSQVNFIVKIKIIKEQDIRLPKIINHIINFDIETKIKGKIDLKNNAASFECDDSQSSINHIIIRVFETVSIFKYHTVHLHASSVEKNGQAFVFFGPQGSGKSTITTLGQSQTLADDFVLLRVLNKQLYIFSSPFDRKLQTVKNLSYPVHKLIHLKQGTKNRLLEYKKNPVVLLFDNIKQNTKYFENSPYYNKQLFVNITMILNQVKPETLYFKKDETFWKELI